MNALRGVSGLRNLPVVLFIALAAWGCETNPTSPPPPGVPVSAVVLSPEADTLGVGVTVQFTAVVYDTSGNPTGAAALSWTSRDPSVFTVNASGRVTGVGEGTAELIAAAGGLADTAFVTVLPAGGWLRQTSGTTSNLNGVFFIGSSGWAVGDGGTVIRTTNSGSTWTRVTSGTSYSLNGVWFTSLSDGWAVGQGGSVFKTTNGGTAWTRLTNVGQGETLTDVYFASRDTGWVVGGSGLVLRTFDRGGSWQSFRIPTSFTLNSVAFAGSRDGWAVGEGGVIAGTHDRGVTWFQVPSLTVQALRAVSRPTLAAAFAVGSQGVAPRTITTPDSVAWELLNAGAQRQFEGVHYPEPATGYGVGYDAALGGMVLRTDDAGLTWEAQVSNTTSRLDDVFFIDALRGWAVGDGGTVIHTARGGRP